MALLEDIVAYLITEGIATEFGKDIFINFLPQEPDEVVAIDEYGSDGTQVGYEAYGRYIQILNRAENVSDASSKSQQLFSSLVKELCPIISLTSSLDVVIVALQRPFKVMVDDKERVSYAFNIRVLTHTN